MAKHKRRKHGHDRDHASWWKRAIVVNIQSLTFAGNLPGGGGEAVVGHIVNVVVTMSAGLIMGGGVRGGATVCGLCVCVCVCVCVCMCVCVCTCVCVCVCLCVCACVRACV